MTYRLAPAGNHEEAANRLDGTGSKLSAARTHPVRCPRSCRAPGP